MGNETHVVIAITRQVGAGGGVLGQRLAKRLGYSYLDRDILRKVADQLGISESDLERWDEHLSRFWDRLTEVFAVGPPEAIYTPAFPRTRARDKQLFELESRVIQEASAHQDVVVIGRGGSWILRHHPGLVSVYLHAPRSVRMAQVMRTYRLDQAPAGELLDRLDSDRRYYLERMTGQTPREAECYHLSIDTHVVGYDLAEEMIARLAHHVRQKLTVAAQPSTP